MGIGQMLAGAALVGTAMYLNRSEPQLGGRHGNHQMALRTSLHRARLSADGGRCVEADEWMEHAWKWRDSLEHDGAFARSLRDDFKFTDSLVAQCMKRYGRLDGLGDDPLAPAADQDPRKADKISFLRTHLAKKYWGSTVLAAQSSTSLRKLSQRIRKYSSSAADDALRAADDAWKLHVNTLALAQKYDADWVKTHAGRTDQKLLAHGEQADSRRDARMDE
jgi:hypothetical protein